MNSSIQRSISNHLPSEVIGEFCLEMEQYLIVALGGGNQTNGREHSPSLQVACLADAALANTLTEIARFEINGCSCAILKGAQKNSQAGLDLTLLLSGRELQIATLVAKGYGNKQVAKQLHISEWTVSSYLRRIFAKLGVESRAAMVYRCAPIIHRLQNLAAEQLD
jgi:DNA-binding CsgD family transcriptional regulator